jgi:hypothetical protein
MSDEPSDGSDYGGMTTNERLFVAGLLDSYDAAALRRDRDRMIELLCEVEFSVSEATSITDTVLSNPKMYGF